MSNDSPLLRIAEQNADEDRLRETTPFARELERELAEANKACRKASEDALMQRDALLKDNAALRAALKSVKKNLCRHVPDGYSQPCVDECAEKCDAVIDAALGKEAKP